MRQESDNSLKDITLIGMRAKRAVVITGRSRSGKTELIKQVSGEMPMITADETAYLEAANPKIYETLAQMHQEGAVVVVSAQTISPLLQTFIDQVKPEIINLT